jgi:glutamate/tyrosine decarboxylase-like PLP-dependent enzyme
MRILGFQKHQLRRLPSDHACRLVPDLLQSGVQEDRAKGLAPFCVIANAGTTNTGAIDPLNDIANLCQQENLWLHADGAYGAAALFSAKGRALLAGIERSDSFSLDPHKWLFQPFDCALLMVRDRSALRRAFHVREDEAEYLQDARGREQGINLWDYSPELTRPFRALKVWMSLQVFGAEAFAAAIERTMRLAEFAEAQLREVPVGDYFRAQMAVVTFRCAPESWPAEVDALNRGIAARMQEEGFAGALHGASRADGIAAVHHQPTHVRRGHRETQRRWGRAPGKRAGFDSSWLKYDSVA